MLIDYGAASPAATVRAQLIAGRAGGAWTGNGITSALAAASGGRTGVGYAEALEIGLTSLDGEPLDQTALLVRYTLLGDVNLDRQVNISDFSVLAANFNVAGVWSKGDMDYSGAVGIGDFALLATNYNAALPTGRTGTVPEPASLVAAAALAVKMLARRHRRK
jgi:hypothetical protein